MARDRFFNRTLTALFVTIALVSAGGMYAQNISVPIGQVLGKLALSLAVLVGAWFYRWRQVDRLADNFMVIFWMGLFSSLHVFPMFVAGRVPCQFRDAELAAIDRALGVQTPEVMAWIDSLPICKHSLERVYETLVLLMALAIIAPAFLNRRQASKEYILACIVSVLLAFPLFAVVQAQGPWTYYGYTPAINQDAYMHTFAALKSQEHFVMDLGYTRGLICFPSFHTILAVLAGVALWSVPYLRWLAAAWAGLIVFSTVTTGTHYVIDVLAGLGVALLSVLAARGFSRLEQRTRLDPRGSGGLTHVSCGANR